MTINVNPDDPITEITHHISLRAVDSATVGLIAGNLNRDGKIVIDETLIQKNPVDRTAMKISQGNNTYGDQQLPYYTLAQDDFSGGRGSRDYEKDTTRFADAGGLNTRRPGFVMLGGQEQFAALLRAGGQLQPGSILFPTETLPTGVDAITEWCTKVLPSANGDYNQIWIYSYTEAAFTLKLYNGADAAFVTLLHTQAVSPTVQNSPGWIVIDLTSPVTLTAASGVWVSMVFSDSDQQFKDVARDTVLTGYRLEDAVSTATYGFPVRVLAKVTPEYGKLFEYKHALYYCQQIAGTVKLWLIGDRGVLTAGATGTATDSTKTWVLNELTDGIFYVIGGTGINEKRRWRKIASNTTNGIITFTDGYTAALAAGTEYVILGVNKAIEITGHGLTRVTDIHVSDGSQIVMFCQGTGTAVRWMSESTVIGVWTRTWTTDSVTEADFMTTVAGYTWRARNSTGGASRCPGTSFTFEADIICGDITSPFTGLRNYVDDSGQDAPAVLKEEITGIIIDHATFKPLRIPMRAVRSEKNGRANLVFDGNLYFSLGNGVERYYYPDVTDIGPNREEGLPENRQGPIVAMSDYPGRFFIGVDAGDSGLSSVMSSGGWHEEWRGPLGQRLWDVYAQPIPGTDLDRLWVATGGDLNWVPLPSETTNSLKDSNMLYNPGGYVETANFFTDMKAIKKFVSRLKLFMEEETGMFDVLYKTEAGTWTRLGTRIDPDLAGNELDGLVWAYRKVNNSQGATYALENYSLQLRIYIRTEDKTETPVLRAVVMDLLARIENKYRYEIPFVLEDEPRDLLGHLDHNQTVVAILAYLDAWSGGDVSGWGTPPSSGPLYMRSTNRDFDSKMVWLLPFNRSVMKVDKGDGRRSYIGSLSLQDA